MNFKSPSIHKCLMIVLLQAFCNGVINLCYFVLHKSYARHMTNYLHCDFRNLYRMNYENDSPKCKCNIQ